MSQVAFRPATPQEIVGLANVYQSSVLVDANNKQLVSYSPDRVVLWIICDGPNGVIIGPAGTTRIATDLVLDNDFPLLKLTVKDDPGLVSMPWTASPAGINVTVRIIEVLMRYT